MTFFYTHTYTHTHAHTHIADLQVPTKLFYTNQPVSNRKMCMLLLSMSACHCVRVWQNLALAALVQAWSHSGRNGVRMCPCCKATQYIIYLLKAYHLRWPLPCGHNTDSCRYPQVPSWVAVLIPKPTTRLPPSCPTHTHYISWPFTSLRLKRPFNLCDSSKSKTHLHKAAVSGRTGCQVSRHKVLTQVLTQVGWKKSPPVLMWGCGIALAAQIL